jgi:hypothetical protein
MSEKVSKMIEESIHCFSIIAAVAVAVAKMQESDSAFS